MTAFPGVQRCEFNSGAGGSEKMIKGLSAASLAAYLSGAVPATAEVELRYGVAFTTEGSEAGDVGVDGAPALGGYVVGDFGRFYVGAWTTTLDSDDIDEIELDLYVGVVHSIGAVEFVLYYTRYLYDDTGDCCGEYGLAAEFPVSESVTVGTTVEYDPHEDLVWTEVGTDYDINDLWAVSAAVGADTGGPEADVDPELEWDVGVTRSVGESAWIDVRFDDSNRERWSWALSAGIDF